MKLILYTDGAARGNPGPAAIGIVLTDTYGHVIQETGKIIGRTTNNVAEYQALLHGLAMAQAHHATELELRMDSELLVRQLQGSYKVRAVNLKPLFERAKKGLARFPKKTLIHIPRELNHRADELANLALDQGHSIG